MFMYEMQQLDRRMYAKVHTHTYTHIHDALRNIVSYKTNAFIWRKNNNQSLD